MSKCAVLDNTRIPVISYGHEDTHGNRVAWRPGTRAPTRDLPITRPTRSGGTAGRSHRGSCGACALVTDVSSAEFTARRTDYAASRKPPTLLLGRLRSDEWARQLFDRELLR